MVAETLSGSTKVLIASVQLEEREGSFTQEQLILESWKWFPDTFGLKGSEDKHPCSNKVNSLLFGNRGLVSRGMLKRIERDDGKRYLLTSKGRDLAYEVAMALDLPFGKPPPTPTPTANGLPDRLNEFLNRVLINSDAFDKIHFQQDDIVTFPEALAFWGVPQDSKGELIAVRLDEFEMDLKMVDEVMKGTNGELTLHCGRSVSWDDLKTIRVLHASLGKHYRGLLGVLKGRN